MGSNDLSTRLWNTRNDLPHETRAQAVMLLKQQLADALDLRLQAKQAHWNVKGPNFIALHELFDQAAGTLEEYADDLGERAVALGGTAFGTVRTTAQRSRLREYPLDIASGAAHVNALASALTAFAASARAAIDASAAFGDAGTADLFTGVSRGVDKLLWQVEAHAVES